MARIVIKDNIESAELISKKTMDILQMCGSASDNDVVTITSGIRSFRRQAVAMYDNLISGKMIRYAAPGREVVAVFKGSKGGREETIEAMASKIEALCHEGRLVSRHCVSVETYRGCNVVDCSKVMPNPRDFVKELIKHDSVSKVITPFSSSYNSNRVHYDAQEPAIHIEIRQ